MQTFARLLGWASRLVSRIGWRGWTAVTLSVLVISALVIARLIDTPASDSGKKTSGDSSESHTSPKLPHDGDAGSHADDVDPSSAPAPQEAIDVAVAFVTEWAKHPASESPEQWWARVSPYAHERLRDGLRLTDPSTVPASKVTGEAESKSAISTTAEVIVPTDAGRILVTCTNVNGTWAVSDFDLEAGD